MYAQRYFLCTDRGTGEEAVRGYLESELAECFTERELVILNSGETMVRNMTIWVDMVAAARKQVPADLVRQRRVAHI